VIEVTAHSSLLAFLRSQGNIDLWPHHLTMTRLVARALRIRRSALIQTGVFSPRLQAAYRLSYLFPALLWEGSAVIAVPAHLQSQLLEEEIPQIQKWLSTSKEIWCDTTTPDQPPREGFQGLWLTSPTQWLADKLHGLQRFPAGIPAIIDGADDLESGARQQLTVALQPRDWEELTNAFPDLAETILNTRVKLAKIIFAHPANPYECYLLDALEQEILSRLYENFGYRRDNQESRRLPMPYAWDNFWQQWQQSGQLLWTAIFRPQGQFSLYCAPVEVSTALSPIWPQQPVVLIGGVVDLDTQAFACRQQLGLGDLTSLKFASDRQSELIQLYLPERLPMPNTPQFQEALIQQIYTLIRSSLPTSVVILVGDVPLKAQVGAALAAEFGSRVQVEKISADVASILVAGWEFWQSHQSSLPIPQLLIIATLPIPSLEDPLVAGRVAYYKKLRKDWFRLYLLPVALRELQRAIAPMRSQSFAPLRECQGLVAILDSRVHHRSYGQQVLAALSPLARINYLASCP